MNVRLMYCVSLLIFLAPQTVSGQDRISNLDIQLASLRQQGPVEGRLAALEQRYREIDEADLKQPPKRDFKIEMEPPEEIKLFRPDPKLLENKFVATMRLLPAGIRHGDEHSASISRSRRGKDKDMSRGYPDDVRQLYELDNNIVRPTTSAFLKVLVERCADDLPPEPLLNYLVSPDCDRDVKRVVMHLEGKSSDSEWAYLIHAPTADDAKTRASAILHLHDCGISRPMQEYFHGEGRKSLDEARQKFAEYQKLIEAIRAEEAKLETPSEITPGILSQLKAQKVMIAVELAGLSARIKACDEMLKDRARVLAGSTLQSVTDMKVKTEIERVGIQQKLDQINAFISEGDQREAIQAKIATLRSSRDREERSLYYIIRDANTYADLVEHYAPREILGNTVRIAPIEWTN